MPKTAEVLANRLRRSILEGDVREGEKLPIEAALMEQFGVSRHVLREAFRILESERLITVRRGAAGGALVLRPEPQVAARHLGILLQSRGTRLEDVQRARIVLEVSAVRALAQTPDPEILAQLRERNDRAEASVADSNEFARLSLDFHQGVVELAGNDTVAVMMSLIREILQLHVTAGLGQQPEDQDSAKFNHLSVRANEKLLGLIESGDPDAAAAFWQLHLAAIIGRLNSREGPLTILELLA